MEEQEGNDNGSGIAQEIEALETGHGNVTAALLVNEMRHTNQQLKELNRKMDAMIPVHEAACRRQRRLEMAIVVLISNGTGAAAVGVLSKLLGA